MEPIKICSKCKKEKLLSEFNNGKIYYDGKTPSCKICIKEAKQTYYLKNKEKIKESVKQYATSNNDVVKKNKKKYYKNNKTIIDTKNKEYNKKNKEKIHGLRVAWYQANLIKSKEASKQWSLNNKDKVRLIKQKYIKNRKQNNPLFKLTENIRTMFSNSLSRKGFKKSSKTHEILGCSYEEFYKYLESKFESWMNWGNRGLYNGDFNYGWDIDHIIPLSTANTENDVIKLNHYTNLQPLCSKFNRDIKKDNLIL